MDTKELYKLAKTPSGRELWTYMAAILQVTEMDKGKAFPLNKFLKNFSTHLQNNRIIKVDGGYQLTTSGQDYFQDRFSTGNRQHIVKSEVSQIASSIKSGQGLGDWLLVK